MTDRVATFVARLDDEDRFAMHRIFKPERATRRSRHGILPGTARALVPVLATLLAAGEAHAVKVAFTADQGVGENAVKVLQLVADENADLLLLQGDFGYDDSNSAIPERWEANLTATLGRDFPVLSVVGNHDENHWDQYGRYIRERVRRASGLSCDDGSDPGVRASCRFGNLEIVQVAPGINDLDTSRNPAVYERDAFRDEDNAAFARYIDRTFEEPSANWRICSFHMNQARMQTGEKGDAAGWEVFDACLDAGALVAMGHEHAYSRTHLLSDYRNQTIADRDDDMTLEPGKSLAFVSGLGGYEVRDQMRFGDDWMASVYTARQNATHGALFCDFGATTAACYFKTIDPGRARADEFTLRLGSRSDTPPPVRPGDRSGYVFARSDKDEWWWIARTDSGRTSKVWIDETCAARLSRDGGREEGDWRDLTDVAPSVGGIDDPCTAPPPEAASTGYVFSRSDKTEYWWIDDRGDGELGRLWIDADCKDRLGVDETGDWRKLTDQAPDTASLVYPCS